MTAKEWITLILLGSKKPKIWHYLIAIPFYTWLFFVLFPYPLFPYKLQYKNATIYSTEEIDSRITSILDTSFTLLQHSSIHEPIKNQEIFLCEGYNYAKVFGLFAHKAFGWNTLGHIYIVKTNIAENYCERNDTEFNKRPLSEVLAHEMVHTLQNKKLGWFTVYRTPNWKIEGYAEYICKNKPRTITQAQEELKALKDNHTISADYYRYDIAVQYLMDQEKYTFEKLMNSGLTMEEVLGKLK